MSNVTTADLCFSARRARSFNDRINIPFYIFAPDYRDNSGGIRVLHYLCHILNEMGEEAYLVNTRITSPRLRTPLLTFSKLKQHFLAGQDPVTIYPEIISENPLNTPLIVRWLLNVPGHLGKPIEFEANDLIYYYEAWCLPQNITGRPLFVHPVDHTYFHNDNNPDDANRAYECYYANKYFLGNKPILEEHRGLISVGQEIKRSHEELAAIFRKAKVLYCYEPSGIISEAQACGCPVLLVRSEYWPLPPDDTHHRLPGTAIYGDENALLKALDSLRLIPETHNKARDNSWVMTKDLVENAYKAQKDLRAGGKPLLNDIQELWALDKDERSAAIDHFCDAYLSTPPLLFFKDLDDPTHVAATPRNRSAGHRACWELTDAYLLWRSRRTPQEIEGQIHAERMVHTWRFRPRYTIAVHIGAAEQLALLADTIDALARQWYPEWRLVVFAANIPEPAEVAGIPQVVWISDAGVQPSYGAALAAADADFLTLLPVGTALDDHALQQISDHINRAGGWLALYLDHDEQDAAGNIRPRFKPDFNVDLLYAQNYIGPAAFICREAISAFPDSDEGGAEAPFGLLVKLFEQASATSIGHIADPMIHLPAERSCTADYEARVLAEHFARTNRPAEVLPGWFEETRRIRFVGADECLVSVIVMTHCLPGYLRCCLESLRAHGGHQNLEVIVVAHCVTEPDLLQLLVDWKGGALGYPVTVLEESGDFNPAAFRNRAAAAASGEALLFLDDDAELFQPDSLRHLLSYLRANGLAAVAPRLVSADEGKARIVGSANILGFQSLAGSIAPADAALLDGSRELRLQLDQSVSSLPSNCLLVDRAWFERLGGFDATAVPMLLHDLDFCLRAVRAGARLTWLPSIDVFHHQGKTLSELAHNCTERERWASAQTNEREVIIDRHLALLASDPNYNRNLSLNEPFRPDIEAIADWDVNFRDRPRLLGVPLTTGAGQYRLVAPFKALSRAALAQCAIVHPVKNNLIRALTAVEVARLAPDTVIYQNCIEEAMIQRLTESHRWNREIFHICTIDDRLGDLPRGNPLYAVHARYGRSQLRKTLAHCDRLIVSTEPLREYCADLIDDIVVVPNRLEREIWTHLDVAINDAPKPRVGWVGAMQHGGDLRLLEPVVRELADEVDWVFMGMCPDFLKPYVHEVHDFVSIRDYPKKMASLALDLALAPLEIHPFNECKSNLRILEYGALGWPVICTDIDPYRTGAPPVLRLPNDATAWTQAIRERIDDRDALRQEGARLRQWVLDGYILENGLESWFSAFTRPPR